MKLNLKGIRFQTWLYFLGFSAAMLALLGFLMVAMIRPYYRENRIDTIGTIADAIEDSMISSNSDRKGAEAASRMVMSNNACVLMYNENGRRIYESDALGELCMLDSPMDFLGTNLSITDEPGRFIDAMKENPSASFVLDSPLTGTKMLVFAKSYSYDLANYYLVINTPLELVDSYVDFILDQYLLVSLLIMVVALILGYFLSSRITLPIIDMKKTAKKLAEGDYSVSFAADSYSEINDLAATLDDAKDKLSRIDELRKDLVANVSHDIKTPLTMIRAYTEMIRDISGNNESKRNEHLETILKETDYLTRLTNDMQMYSKMQAGYIELNRSNFDLMSCTEDVIDLLDKLIKEKEIDLKTDLKEVTIYGDELKFSQVIYNFVSNAIKHSSQGSSISIRIIDSEEKVRFEVEDNGDGISEEALPHIWDRYYKIDKSFRRNENSTGLGLAIAKAILDAHKAGYGVESEVGVGSTFYFEMNKDYDDE